MSLTVGTRIGPYELISLLGAGGMGEVYRATDTVLKRQVALKVLPPAVADNAERVARFQREAEVLAALNHPNIAHLYGIETSNGTLALVMELVEGPTLADRIAKGPIPLDEALPIAKQIAEALEAAHEQGIIHRDLKPANIKVREDGTVKVLDFGLAKALEPAAADVSVAALTNSPTITSPVLMTGVGVLLGTAAYMAPEQARGKPADKRGDIWAFGCVFYEMLTGDAAFPGASVAELLAASMRDDPDWSRLPPALHPELVRLLRRCLAKDVRQRMGDVHDVRLALEDAVGPTSTSTRPTAVAKERRWAVPAGGVVLVAASLIAGVLIAQTHFASPENFGRDVVDFGVEPPPGTAILQTPSAIQAELSPDGRRLAFRVFREGQQLMALRTLDRRESVILDGTANAQAPAWSPDSRSLAFLQGGKIRRLDLETRRIDVVSDYDCQANGAGGMSWSRDGLLLCGGRDGGLATVPVAGGEPTVVSTPDKASGESVHRFPQFLPDGEHFLYVGLPPTTAYVGSIRGGAPRRLLTADSRVRFALDHLLFVRAGTLFSQRFDVSRFELEGEPRPVGEGLRGNTSNAGSAFSPSVTGVLATASARTMSRLAWLDRSGREVAPFQLSGNEGERVLLSPTISPDGKRVAVQLLDGVTARSDLWAVDVERVVATRIADGLSSGAPVWSPDSKRVAFYREVPKSLASEVVTKEARAGGDATVVATGAALGRPTGWSPDGRFILFLRGSRETGSDVWGMNADGRGEPFVVVQTPAEDRYASFSPDGTWIVYDSAVSGRFEVYAQPFPSGEGRVQVSANGGGFPRWRADGREIIFTAPDGTLSGVAVTAVPSGQLRFAAQMPLFRVLSSPALSASGLADYAVSADGERFLVNLPDPSAVSPLRITVNWMAKSFR